MCPPAILTYFFGCEPSSIPYRMLKNWSGNSGQGGIRRRSVRDVVL
jgi:hypothetical protein